MEENQERIWKLIARKFSGDASSEEMAELELLLLQNPNENYSMEILEDLWLSNPEFNRQYAENKYKELVLRMKQMGIDKGGFTYKEETIGSNGLKNPNSKKWIFGVVAFIITGLAVYLLLQNNTTTKAISSVQQEEPLARHEVKTKYGSKTSMVLPDGSKVWLNAGSKMTYDKNYGIDLREINLTGEAYFDVVKNADKPFIIHAGKVNIRVLGTAFNVRCYPDEKNTETSLVRGSLEITMSDSKEKYILKPNEKLIVNNNLAMPAKDSDPVNKKSFDVPENEIELSSLSRLQQDNSIIETSWVNNRLVFKSETFEEVALKMERWYAVSIAIKEGKLKTKRFTGVFENETVSEALDAIQLTTPFSYRITREQIIITK